VRVNRRAAPFKALGIDPRPPFFNIKIKGKAVSGGKGERARLDHMWGKFKEGAIHGDDRVVFTRKRHRGGIVRRKFREKNCTALRRPVRRHHERLRGETTASATRRRHKGKRESEGTAPEGLIIETTGNC